MISACFTLTGKTPLFTASSKLAEIKYEKRSLLSFIVFVGKSPCWVAFDVSKLFMILIMHSGLIKSKEKILVVSMFSCITFILGWFWYSSMAFIIVTVSLFEEIFVRPSTPSIPRFWTIFPNYLLKISTDLLSSETTLLFSAKVILSSFKVLSVKEGFTVLRMYFTLIVSHKNFSDSYVDLVAYLFFLSIPI